LDCLHAINLGICQRRGGSIALKNSGIPSGLNCICRKVDDPLNDSADKPLAIDRFPIGETIDYEVLGESLAGFFDVPKSDRLTESFDKLSESTFPCRLNRSICHPSSERLLKMPRDVSYA